MKLCMSQNWRSAQRNSADTSEAEPEGKVYMFRMQSNEIENEVIRLEWNINWMDSIKNTLERNFLEIRAAVYHIKLTNMRTRSFSGSLFYPITIWRLVLKDRIHANDHATPWTTERMEDAVTELSKDLWIQDIFE